MKRVLLLAIFLAGCTLPIEFGFPEMPVLHEPETSPVLEQPVLLNGTYRIVIADIGQGSATIIQTPDGKNIVYDCGQYFDRFEDDLARFNVRNVDLLITSHPDADHIGGCRTLLEEYPVARVVDNGFDSESITSMHYRRLVNESQNYIRRAQDTTDEEFPFIKYILPYDTATFKDANENSIGLKLTFGNATILFTGDCETECEEELVKTTDLDADVYIAGHHGSRTSSTVGALNEITPDVVLISAGEDNRYGHPHPEALARIRKHTENIFSTAERGYLVIETNGDTLTVSDINGLVLWKDV